MSPSPPFAAPRRVQKRLLRWVTESKDLIRELKDSGLVVNASDDPPADGGVAWLLWLLLWAPYSSPR